MTAPFFSIIVPVFNVEKFLPKCIASILSQDFTDWELLLVDDGSSDNSGVICDEFEKIDERIRVFHQKNEGVSCARNVGLSNARGEWLAFVDSDDYVDSDWLAVVKKEISTHTANIYTWGNYYETESGVECNSQYIPENRRYQSATEFIGTVSYRHGSVWYLYQMEWIRKYRCQFPIGVKRSEDQCFLLQYLSHNPRIHSIVRPFYHYIQRSGSVCNSPFSIDDIKDNLRVATIFAKYALEYKDIDSIFVFNSTTRLFYDFFHYLRQINKLYDGYAQTVYRIYYKEMCHYFPLFKNEAFLRRAYYSIEWSYKLLKYIGKTRMLIKQRIKQMIHPFRVIDEMVRDSERKLSERITLEKIDQNKDTLAIVIKERLKNLALVSTESGITKSQICDHEVVVSLTTYSYRIHEVYLTIESIMQGTVKPNRIILWLAEDEFGGKTLPVALQNQMKRGLEVRYCEDLRSYKKIIPTLDLYPDACIVTIDDDALYESDLLEHLIASYKSHPDCVSACRVHKIKTDENGFPLPYMQWDMLKYNAFPSVHNFITGVGGVLYPPHSLSKMVADRNLYMQLCPHGDDIWLYAMLVLNGVKVVKAFTHDVRGDDYVLNESQYVQSLWSSNQEENGNDPQIRAVWREFNLQKYFVGKIVPQ